MRTNKNESQINKFLSLNNKVFKKKRDYIQNRLSFLSSNSKYIQNSALCLLIQYSKNLNIMANILYLKKYQVLLRSFKSQWFQSYQNFQKTFQKDPLLLRLFEAYNITITLKFFTHQAQVSSLSQLRKNK
ncbi:hypothetical protein TTHERM_00730260 (macronuclear) [Tetrahymena thermophila SB210]|uniref:Uncharacterized protein n=1 Tax=Tetrahymena thermophila (strain SB210) TaxID=312017 RepID=Q245I7_TETTS|nr:hypothetical protein TTHERM_00730260 [Tetrahymena thermophila SB210]EAS03377.1 hypothetical protein TTHERM_00730260 [Tetrahymena thermophila SB210]|eukprot:XP_001023622.1 hypothetical protein TTHERM_00730260 [Tetrahymena thermophila SB210]